MGSKDCGFLAHSEEGWYSSLEMLIKSSDLRNKISKNAKKLFIKNYNQSEWTNKFINELKKYEFSYRLLSTFKILSQWPKVFLNRLKNSLRKQNLCKINHLFYLFMILLCTPYMRRIFLTKILY